MNANPNADKVSLLPALQDLVAEHGALRTLLALMKASFGRKSLRRGHVRDQALTDHLRRDIGLNQRPDVPPLWEHYR